MEWLKNSIDYGIIGLLVAMSTVSLAIALERFYLYWHLKIEDYKDKRSLELLLTRGLHVIATVGSSAPYVGLLGTVLGIMLTFQTMGKEGFMDAGKIMIGLSLALKATAIGLLVAIPAVVFYNLLLRKVKVLLMQWEIKNKAVGQ